MLHVVRDRTTDYATMVVSGGKVAGRLEILSCKRHLRDLEELEGYYFDVEEAEFAIDYANTLETKDGVLKTRGFQNFIIGSLMGWIDKEFNTRRYSEAYIQVGRRNGKSFITGVIATYFSIFLAKEDRIFCAATKKDQAKIVWKEIKKFINNSSDLKPLYKIQDHESLITNTLTDTEIKALGRDSDTMDGFGNILAINDELHAHKTNEMYRVLQGGQGEVDNALTLAITTAGKNLNSFCHQQYEYCVKILTRAIVQEDIFIFICQPDKGDDPEDPISWMKANPFLLFEEDGVTLNKKQEKKFRSMAKAAMTKGGKELSDFLTKRLNLWVKSIEDGYVDLEKFGECAAEMTLEDMRGKKAFLGFDLSSGGDLTSIGLLFRLPKEKVYVYSHSFMPCMRLEEHKQTDDAPYDIWVRQGLLTLTEAAGGWKTDYNYIVRHLNDIIERYSLEVIECGYDAHNAGSFLADLDFLGCPLTEVKQSAKSMNEPTIDFKQSIDALQVLYDKDNALLRWSVANATLTTNSFGEVKIDKQKQTNRIDPVDAILDAWKVMIANNEQTVDINEAVGEWLDSF